MAAILQADFTRPHQLLAAADFLVLPSRAEPFGLVVAEAQRYGAAPLVRAVDGLADQVKDGETGLSFNAFHPLVLRRTLEAASASWQQGYWQQRYQRLHQRAYYWPQQACKWQQLLNWWAAGGRRSGARAIA